MIQQPNLQLKGAIISKYGKIDDAARDFGIDYFRLSRILHGKAQPKQAEKTQDRVETPTVDQ